MKFIYPDQDNYKSLNSSTHITPRDTIIGTNTNKKLDILNRKEELKLVNNIHMNELRK